MASHTLGKCSELYFQPLLPIALHQFTLQIGSGKQPSFNEAHRLGISTTQGTEKDFSLLLGVYTSMGED